MLNKLKRLQVIPVYLFVIFIAYIYFYWVVQLFEYATQLMFFWLWACGFFMTQTSADSYMPPNRRRVEMVTTFMFWPFYITWTFFSLRFKQIRMYWYSKRKSPYRPPPVNEDDCN